MSMAYDLATTVVRTLYDRRISGPSVLATDDHFPSAQHFAANWSRLAAEAREVADHILAVPRFHELMSEQVSISATDDRDWRMYVLKAYGVAITRNLARCPVLARLLAAAPEVDSAAISFLAPGKHVPVHRGPFRGILRYHLMLSVPLDAAGQPLSVLTIDGVEHRLKDGDTLLWDDTYQHEVCNRGGRVRAALLLDVRRPRLPWDLAVLSRVLVALVGCSIRLRPSMRRRMAV